MDDAGPSTGSGTGPHVVLVRPSQLSIDARGKKMALTLARAGYRVTILALSPDGEEHRQAVGPVSVRLVPVTHTRLDAARARQQRRRAWRPRLPGFATGSASDRLFRLGWAGWTRAHQRVTVLVDERRSYPELGDWAAAFRPLLEDLEPDVVHAHDPKVLGAAWQAVTALRARGRDTRLVYDAREDFAGLPPKQKGYRRRFQALLDHERRYARHADAVLTVSEPIAGRLRDRLGLARRPVVVLNVPVARELATDPVHDVRSDAKLDAAVPLLVYSGGVHRSRGVGLLVEAMPRLPEVHLAIITVPFPHPQAPALLERARELGVAERVAVLPPVPQGELLDYLSTATVGVHPLEGGFPNHDSALPNKLFEYLHAGLPLVVSDAREMAAFVRRHGLGDVFRTGDAADLARAVLAVLDGGAGVLPAERRAALVEQFSWQHQEPVVWEVYAGLLGDRAPAPPADLGAFPALDLA